MESFQAKKRLILALFAAIDKREYSEENLNPVGNIRTQSRPEESSPNPVTEVVTKIRQMFNNSGNGFIMYKSIFK